MLSKKPAVFEQLKVYKAAERVLKKYPQKQKIIFEDNRTLHCAIFETNTQTFKQFFRTYLKKSNPNCV